MWHCLKVHQKHHKSYNDNFDGLVQGRRNSSALAMELCLSCTNPLIYEFYNEKKLHICPLFSIKYSLIASFR